jgi:hypothetical protein
LIVVPLIALTWNTSSPFGNGFAGMLLGHAWLIFLGIFVGEFLSRRLTAARLLLFRHRFEAENQASPNPPPQKGLYVV